MFCLQFKRDLSINKIKNKMKTKILLLLVSGVILVSCSTTHLLTDDSTQQYSPGNPENIVVYTQVDINRSYTIIGEVIAIVEAFSDDPVYIDHLKREAAQIGADAIINLKLDLGDGMLTNTITASGTAVKFNNLP
jgi:uncharacterized protein YbjQ (UPF0145 family)